MKVESFEKQFVEIVGLIKQARYNSIKSVNKELVELYWRIGEHVSKKISNSEWGKGIIQKLANYINASVPDAKGFSGQNIWRMKQFY
jgi:hypothetical protein